MGSRIQFYNYLKLMNNQTNYGKRMSRLRNRIFGDPVRPTQPTSYRVIKKLSVEPMHKREMYTQYYPRHQETHSLIMSLRDYGLFRDEHEDFKEEMIRQHILRGKTPWNPKEKRLKKKST